MNRCPSFRRCPALQTLAVLFFFFSVQFALAGNWTITAPLDNQVFAPSVNIACSGTGPNNSTCTVQALDKSGAVRANFNATASMFGMWSGTLTGPWSTSLHPYKIKLLPPIGDTGPADLTFTTTP